jgi:pimeloyl-ACP methyl ester carboxylesterase
MATYVLVPGAWHGGWYLQGFAEALRARGHRAYAATLTGLGERRHLLGAHVNLDTHIEDVVRLLEMENLSEVVLLGHSYAGMVVSGVLDRAPQRVAAAIYVDAYVPRSGQSCFRAANDHFRRLFLECAAEDGFSVLPPPGLDPRTTPHPLASLLQRLHLNNPPPPVRRGYIHLAGWQPSPFTPTYERLKTAPEWRTFDLPVDHDMMAAAFDDVLGIALEFA